MNQNKSKLRKEILDSFPKPTMRNPDGITTDTAIADLLHYDDPITIITECKFLWQDRYLEKGIATRRGTVYSLTQEGIKARDTLYNPEGIKKMEKEIQEAKENAKPIAIINPAGGTYAPGKGPHIAKPKPPSKPTFIQKNKRSIEIGSILTVIPIALAVLSIPGVYDAIFPPEPEIFVTDLTAQGGKIEGNKLYYSYEPTSLTPNGTKNEVFSLKISNTGDANANDFWIIMDSKPDGLWFDFRSSNIIHEGNPIPCQQQSSYCTIGLVPKASSNLAVEYNVDFDHKLYQEIKDQNPKVFFNYGFDEGEEQTIEVFLKFD